MRDSAAQRYQNESINSRQVTLCLLSLNVELAYTSCNDKLH